MDSDPIIPIPFEDPHLQWDATQASASTLVTPITIGTITSFASSGVLIDIEKECIPDIFMEGEDEELHFDLGRPSQSK